MHQENIERLRGKKNREKCQQRSVSKRNKELKERKRKERKKNRELNYKEAMKDMHEKITSSKIGENTIRVNQQYKERTGKTTERKQQNRRTTA